MDLTKTGKGGEFFCPRCGTEISPDDETDEAYSIMETKAGSLGLEEVTIRCNRCSSQICLTGFSFMKESSTNEATLERLDRNGPFCYVTHV